MSNSNMSTKNSLPLSSVLVVCLSVSAFLSAIGMLTYGGIFKTLSPVLIGVSIIAGALLSSGIKNQILRFCLVASGVLIIGCGFFLNR